MCKDHLMIFQELLAYSSIKVLLSGLLEFCYMKDLKFIIMERLLHLAQDGQGYCIRYRVPLNFVN